MLFRSNREEYAAFYAALEQARSHTPHDWEKLEFFEGCMPIEEIARRGVDTPRFGPLKPKGLPDPRTGREPYAVAQLRQEDTEGRLWSIVGFQTGLKWGNQKEVVRLIPGLENAEIARYGVSRQASGYKALCQKRIWWSCEACSWSLRWVL